MSIIFLAQIVFLGGSASETLTLGEVNTRVQRVYDAVVTSEGTVDYIALNRDQSLRDDLEAYVRFAADFDPETIVEEPARIAFFANTYNAFTLAGVARHWPVTSVRKIKAFFGFFTGEDWQLGGQKISLNQLEKKYLRPLDPRIHFIINCASAACPKLLPSVFTAANIEAQMERATREFLADGEKNIFDEKKWQLSKIFDWYQDDWGKKADVVAFIQKYRADLVGKTPTKISYLEYDWALNGPVEP